MFCALYCDRASHFFETPKAGGKIDPERVTQVGRALRELGIRMIPAYSPQARGRSEGSFGTWQGRLPQELRLRGITTLEEANRFLREEYIAEFNRKFRVAAAQPGSAFLRLQGQDLERIFSVQQERVVNRDNTVQIGNRVLQIQKTPWRDTLAGSCVVVYEHLDGTFSVGYGPHTVGRFNADGIPLQEIIRRRRKAVEKTVKSCVPTALGNPANARFPLSHSLGGDGVFNLNWKADTSRATKSGHLHVLPTALKEVCRSKMRMSGLCKVEMSGFIQGGRRDGTGANRVECQRAGTVEGLTASRRRSSATNPSGPEVAFNRAAGARLQARLGSEGDRGIVHRLRGRGSNRKIPESVEQHAMRHLRQARYAGFGPTLAAEHLARGGMSFSRETLRKWMSAAGLWRPRNRRLKTAHVWRPRRSSFGELVMMDSSPYRWLEERGPACHLIALIDDASSRVWGRLVEHDSTEENLRTLGGWLERYGRPLALYTDKNSLFVTSRPAQWQEQLRGEPARTVRAGSGGVEHRVERRALTASQRTRRAVVRGAARPAGERDAPAANRHTRAGQSFSGDDLLAVLATAFCRAAGHGRECPPATGGQPSAGGNSQRAGGAHGGSRSHGQLAGPALGRVARTGLRRLTRGARGDRTASGRFALAAFPRPLPAAARLSGGAAIGNSFRPTACRSRRSKTQSSHQGQNQIHSPAPSPLEERLEADISTLR